jgi:glycosyltransferase involved in cell wall biosynthesis
MTLPLPEPLMRNVDLSSWPWSPISVMTSGSGPLISIIIPSFNLADYLERAIRSVLAQGHARFELLVVDGGSSDGSVAVLEHYAPWLAWWESVPDRGQSHAINKGFVRATGEIVAWLGCDDLYLPGALAEVGRMASARPDAALIVGHCRIVEHVGERRERVDAATPESLALMPCTNPVPQPSAFVRRSALERNELVLEAFHYAMDAELWNHLVARGGPVVLLETVLSEFHLRSESKSARGGEAIIEEMRRVYRSYGRDRLESWYGAVRLPLDRALLHAPFPVRALGRIGQVAYTAALAPFYGTRRVRALNAWSCFLTLAAAQDGAHGSA